MKNGFILLTDADDNPIIIGVSNIAHIQVDETYVDITLNYVRGENSHPELIQVKESFDEIKDMLGLGESKSTKFILR